MKNLTKVVHPHCQHLRFQEKTNWCWAATTSNVELCNGKNVAQCAIAANSLPNYSVACSSNWCNTPYFLTEALKSVKNFGGHYGYRIARDYVRYQLDHDRPVGVRIAWEGSDDGHFILIVGYGFKRSDELSFFYLVFDPLADQGFQALPARNMERINGYHGKGTWAETILTA